MFQMDIYQLETLIFDKGTKYFADRFPMYGCNQPETALQLGNLQTIKSGSSHPENTVLFESSPKILFGRKVIFSHFDFDGDSIFG